MQIAIALILIVASVLISSLLVHTGKQQKPATIKDFDIPQVDEGTPQAVLFGQCWNKGWQCLWYGELATKKIKAKTSK
jgi:hypothetical protein